MAKRSNRKRRSFVAAAIIGLVAVATVATYLLMPPAPKSAAADMVIYKHPQCGCCTNWTRYIEESGFDVAVRAETNSRERWTEHDVPPQLGSCHTAVIGGYIIEGHVPVEDIRRLLEERPDAVGLVLPGMPIGSPGMEGPNPEAYEVLLLKHDGTTEVYQRHVPRES